MYCKFAVPVTLLLLKAVTAADLVSLTESTEFGAYVNPNPKNICEGEELETLTTCASEVLAKLDDCKPDDLACECCALQSMKRDCFGLCPNTASGNFLGVLYDDCETMNDVNACNLPFKKHDTHVAQFLRPNSRIPVEEKEPDFVIKSVLENTTNISNSSTESFTNDHFDSFESNTTTYNLTNVSVNSNSSIVQLGGASASYFVNIFEAFIVFQLSMIATAIF